MAEEAGMIRGALPHSDEAERAVLADVLLDPSRLEEARVILASGTMFYSARNRLIFGACCAVADSGGTLDLVTLVAQLRDTGNLDSAGGPAYIAALLDGYPRSRNVGDHARIIAEKSRRRSILIRLGAIEKAARNGASARDLDELVAGLAEERGPEGAQPLPTLDLGCELPPVPDPLVGDGKNQIIMPGEITVIAADPGVGKTKLLGEMALAIASGGKCLGLPVIAGPVVFITSDGDPDLPRNLRRQWIGRGGDPAKLGDLPLHVHVDPGFCLEARECYERLGATIDKVRPVLVIVESLATNVRETNLNEQVPVRTFVNGRVRPFLAPPGLAFVISAHLKKPQPGASHDLASRIAGSIQIRGAVDSVIALVPAGRDAFVVRGRDVKRSRSGGAFEPFRVRIVGERTEPLQLVNDGPMETSPEELRGAAQAVMAYMRRVGGRQPLKAIVKALEGQFKARPAQKACAKLAAADPPLLVRVGEKPALYELAPEKTEPGLLDGLD